MTRHEFLGLIQDLRVQTQSRLAAIRRREDVYGSLREMKAILDELEALERIVGGGGELPSDRGLISSYMAGDQFPLRDEIANAIFTLQAEYRTLR